MTIKHFTALFIIVLGIWANLALQDALAESNVLDWELRQLHQPSPALLKRENRGQVTIYDRLPSDEIDKAMDHQFDRIDKMMFIRTQYPVDDDELMVDDGCD